MHDAKHPIGAHTATPARADDPRRSASGDLLVADSRLIGVLDAGGFGPADPALDLVAAWHLLADGREVIREALECDDDEWARGKAWAYEQGLGAAWYYEETNPARHEMGMTTLRRLLASEG